MWKGSQEDTWSPPGPPALKVLLTPGRFACEVPLEVVVCPPPLPWGSESSSSWKGRWSSVQQGPSFPSLTSQAQGGLQSAQASCLRDSGRLLKVLYILHPL